MVCISLQLAEKPSAAGVLDDQEASGTAGFPVGTPSSEPQAGHGRSGLRLRHGSFLDGGHEREGIAGGTVLAVPGAHVRAEMALHSAGTSRPSKARLRIACRNLPQRARLAATVAST